MCCNNHHSSVHSNCHRCRRSETVLANAAPKRDHMRRSVGFCNNVAVGVTISYSSAGEKKCVCATSWLLLSLRMTACALHQPKLVITVVTIGLYSSIHKNKSWREWVIRILFLPQGSADVICWLYFSEPIKECCRQRLLCTFVSLRLCMESALSFR